MHAMKDEECADDEFRCGDMLARKEPGELGCGLNAGGVDRLAVEFIDLVHLGDQTGNFRGHE